MRRLWLIFSQAATVALAVFFVVATLKPQWLYRDGVPLGAMVSEVVSLRTAAPAAAGSPTPAGALPFYGLADAARLASPSVVSVITSKARRQNPHADDPNFGFFFGDRGRDPVQQGVGSGVIVSAQGILLTNNHVVEDAGEIDVRLADGREARAEVVGTDPETDLAVLRIKLDRLPVITLGRSQDLRVGDALLAIGNPFNVGQTVTAGIVSALGRNGLGLSTFESFIQTDAAINPGNSGGALINAQGHLVGINTAIYSPSGGSLGIGFAIPTDMAQKVMESLIRDGVVQRGWIGVEPRELTPEIAESLNLASRSGVLITGVLQDGPASKGGLRPGDVVVAVAGAPVATVAQLLDKVAALPAGQPATVKVQRGQKELTLTLDVVQRKRPPRRQR
ncbi:MAG: trypsin-like peptidase domain-containing protein [Microbacteriaceae bacterium]|nr:trypsin-like peptidase domain-containing protein [Burkholderiaceae bacterium]